MYGIALSVAACLRGGTRVHTAWNLDPALSPRFDPADAVAITPGGGRLGGLLGGAIDSHLIELAAAKPTSGRIIEIELNPIEAEIVGAAAGTRFRIMVAPADTLPDDVWDRLVERRRIGLVADVDGGTVTGTHLLEDPTGDAGVTIEPGSIRTVWTPTPTLVVMGTGPMAAAVAGAGSFLGWHVDTVSEPDAAVGRAAALSPIDGIVVVGHDIEGTGRVLQAALASRTGYIGSLGPPSIQQARGEWLAYRGITDIDRVRAPAGLDIGARTPREIAISVIAEMIAIRPKVP